jgi:hypothetical protein
MESQDFGAIQATVIANPGAFPRTPNDPIDDDSALLKFPCGGKSNPPVRLARERPIQGSRVSYVTRMRQVATSLGTMNNNGYNLMPVVLDENGVGIFQGDSGGGCFDVDGNLAGMLLGGDTARRGPNRKALYSHIEWVRSTLQSEGAL